MWVYESWISFSCRTGHQKFTQLDSSLALLGKGLNLFGFLATAMICLIFTPETLALHKYSDLLFFFFLVTSTLSSSIFVSCKSDFSYNFSLSCIHTPHFRLALQLYHIEFWLATSSQFLHILFLVWFACVSVSNKKKKNWFNLYQIGFINCQWPLIDVIIVWEK